MEGLGAGVAAALDEDVEEAELQGVDGEEGGGVGACGVLGTVGLGDVFVQADEEAKAGDFGVLVEVG